ncbi:hypothetical protein [Cupriavidus sp. D384]|uniref:hypothetical protein n=1 Tax=Cupriavidus sp. D384 TaxID=1538095 RepID=UPI000836220B|nr:hypothetical protein [Cupriavidus sp. D384]
MVRNALRDTVMLEQYVNYLQTRVAKQQAVVAQLRACGLDPHEDQIVLENLEGATAALARQLDQMKARPALFGPGERRTARPQPVPA